MVLNDKQRQIGMDNYKDAVRISRRQMLSGVVAAPAAAYSMYWGYEQLKGKPVKAGLIGTGNQGCYAHISQSNPDFVDIVAFSEIRPSNQERARRLFNEKYGKKAGTVELYEDYKEMIDKRDDIELIIIALPLHLHEPATVYALERGKHVLCEKLMAKTVSECKNMIRVARENNRFLAVGHQRHYSYMYANALSLLNQGILGDVRHINAYWHRNQTIDRSVHPPMPGAEGAKMGKFDSWHPAVPDMDKSLDATKYGYESVEQLIRWRLDNRTGGGLMVELGSHQLDACSIFLHHAKPKAVHGTGKVSFFEDGREVDDHIFLTYDFGEEANDAVVTYSSICTNAFDGYGEQVNGTKGTMIIQQEADAYLFREGGDAKNTRINWAEARMEKPAMDTGSTAVWATGVDTADTLTSRGYREEQEHMAWLIREIGEPDGEHDHRCNGMVALADAVVALTSNLAMDKQRRIEFKKEWFDPESDAAPETDLA
jgi:predicted dehydrogenase